MQTLLVGLLLLALAWYAHRQVAKGRGHDRVPPVLKVNEDMLRGAVPVLVLIGVVTLLVGISSLLRDGTSRTTAGPAEDTWERCVARLRVDEALLDLTTAPFSDGRGVVEEIDAITPPEALRSEWADLLALLEMATVEAVHPDDVSDERLLEQGRRAMGELEIHGIVAPCDPSGLPASFGCTDLEACAHELTASPDEDLGTATVVAALSVHGWSVVDCSDLGGVNRCELAAAAGQAQAEVEFGTTTDDRLFAWRLRITRGG